MHKKNDAQEIKRLWRILNDPAKFGVTLTEEHKQKLRIYTVRHLHRVEQFAEEQHMAAIDILRLADEAEKRRRSVHVGEATGAVSS